MPMWRVPFNINIRGAVDVEATTEAEVIERVETEDPAHFSLEENCLSWVAEDVEANLPRELKDGEMVHERAWRKPKRS